MEGWSLRNGELRYGEKLCVPNDSSLKEEILGECHRSKFAIHPGSTKMYRDMKRQYWWKGRNLRCGQVCGTMCGVPAGED